ncbi:hypothetical protein CTRI78_v001065 [Colletotrichum trifolii]|uniref:ABM domain-containing protein n=1 Tax=Colletotrichum trifolii TaxID=5466 RepID=A0A4R8RUQ0_COLTR|nr:hypothetical protein CTRI78_v001065 [Colletotrichum trifolii]
MPQVVELGWIPVKHDYEHSSAGEAIEALEPKLMQNHDVLGYWKGIKGHGALDATPIKGCDLATVWKSVEAARAAKQTAEFQQAAKLWGQIVETDSHYGPVQPWVDYFLLDGDEFETVIRSKVVLLSGFYLNVDADIEAFSKTWEELNFPLSVSPGYIAGTHGWSVGNLDHKGGLKKVFMAVTGWENAETMKTAIANDKAQVDERLKALNVQQHEHVSHGLSKIK